MKIASARPHAPPTRALGRLGDRGALLEQLCAYSIPPASRPPARGDLGGLAAPPRLATDDGEFASICTVTIFGTPLGLTLAELAIEAFFPADETIAEALRRAVN
jgi:hypothetical protein